MAKQSKAKQTKTFLKKGLLDQQIKQRHDRRKFQQKVKNRQMKRNKGKQHMGNGADKDTDAVLSDEDGPVKRTRVHAALGASDDEDDEDDEDMDVDAVLGAAGLGDRDDASKAGSGGDDDEVGDRLLGRGRSLSFPLADEYNLQGSDLSDDDLSNLSDNDSVNSEKHVADLKALAEKDPEFFKYLQENDAELLDFAGEEDEDDDGNDNDDEVDPDEEYEDSDADAPTTKKAKGKERAVDGGEAQIQVLTRSVLKSMQKSVLEVRRSGPEKSSLPDRNLVCRLAQSALCASCSWPSVQRQSLVSRMISLASGGRSRAQMVRLCCHCTLWPTNVSLPASVQQACDHCAQVHSGRSCSTRSIQGDQREIVSRIHPRSRGTL